MTGCISHMHLRSKLRLTLEDLCALELEKSLETSLTPIRPLESLWPSSVLADCLIEEALGILGRRYSRKERTSVHAFA